eukprot:gene26275-34900_t
MQTTPSDANTLIKDVPSKSFHVISQKKFKTALLVVSYMSIIVSIMSFPSVMKLIDNDKQLRQNEHNLFPSTAEIVSTATMCIMGGKFLFGPVTDTIGGEAMLFICMIAMGSLLATCAFTGSLNNFAVSWTIISFFYASAWGAVGSVIRASFPSEQWAEQIGIVASGSRVGSIFSAVLFGRVISIPSRTWRSVFWVASAIQLLVSVVYAIALKAMPSQPGVQSPLTANNETDLDGDSQGDPLRQVASNSRFWLMLLGKSCLMMSGQFMTFLPLYLSTGLKLPANHAATNSALFAMADIFITQLGSLLSNLYGTRIYVLVNVEVIQVTTIAGFNIAGGLLVTLLALQSLSIPWVCAAMPQPVLLLAIFLWGFAWSLPFYIPAGVMALQLGGRKHAALLTNIFDAAGFLVAAVFSLPAGRYGSLGGKHWFPVLATLAAGQFIAALAMFISERIPTNTQKKQE